MHKTKVMLIECKLMDIENILYEIQELINREKLLKQEKSKMEYKTGEEVEVLIDNKWVLAEYRRNGGDNNIEYLVRLLKNRNFEIVNDNEIRKKINSEDINKRIESIESQIKEVKGMVEKLNDKKIKFQVGSVFQNKNIKVCIFFNNNNNTYYLAELQNNYVIWDNWTTTNLDELINDLNKCFKYKGQLSDYLKEVD